MASTLGAGSTAAETLPRVGAGAAIVGEGAGAAGALPPPPPPPPPQAAARTERARTASQPCRRLRAAIMGPGADRSPRAVGLAATRGHRRRACGRRTPARGQGG